MIRTRRVDSGVRGDRDLLTAFAEWQAAVVRLADVDAPTTEIVRMRCAAHHDCHT